MTLFDQHIDLIDEMQSMQVTGKLSSASGLTLAARGLRVPVGTMCVVRPQRAEPIEAQVIGFNGDVALLMPLAEPFGIAAGDSVTSSASLQYVAVGQQLVGRVLDGTGRPMDGLGGFAVESHYPVMAASPDPLDRREIDQPLGTGIRSIDALHSVGKGQRLGVFAGTGVGKSVLMGMIARNTSSDVTVVALVGERGREVGDFIRKDLGEEGMKKTVMVVSTSDKSPVLRVRAGFVAAAISEYFRDQGADVLLMMDSVTRMAMAQRQIGLAAGEPPTTKGYTPSVFSLLPQLLERSGKTSKGSITGLFTVLVEGDDINEPIADAVRGTLDGHVWLSRDLANRGHYPAVSTLESISRVMPDIVSEEHKKASQEIRTVLATWADIEDLVNIGAYAAGTNVDYDVAVKMKPEIDMFLRQSVDEFSSIEDANTKLMDLAGRIVKMRSELERAVVPRGG